MELVETELGFWVTKKMTNVLCIMANIISSFKYSGKSLENSEQKVIGTNLLLYLFVVVLGIEPRATCMLSK